MKISILKHGVSAILWACGGLVFVCAAMAGLCAADNQAEGLTATLEGWDGIVWWQRKATLIKAENAPGGKPCMRIDVMQPNYELLGRVLVFPQEVSRVLFQGEIKAEGVKAGPNHIDQARAIIQFLDENGEMVGDWPECFRCAGTTDWIKFSRVYDAPAGTRAVRVMLGLYLSTGAMYAREVILDAFDKEGDIVPPLTVNATKTDTSGWYAFDAGAEDESRPLVYDFAELMPAPAGGDGFVRAQNGQFVTESGRNVRFWGSNESFAIFEQSKEELSKLALHYQRNGINMIRLHHLDNGWSDPLVNIFDKSVDNTLAFDAQRVDKMDYFVAECKKLGIYIFVDLLVSRKFKAGDGVRDWKELGFGAKIAAHYNPRLIELQKEYARAFLDRVNPYTKMKYTEDPAVALLGIINESAMFWQSGYGSLPKSYIDELQELFAAWCKGKGIATPQGEVRALLAKNESATIEFLKHVQDSYFDEMTRFLRDDLKFKGLISGSNHWDGFSIDTHSNSRYDFVDRHSYWDHPMGGFTATCNFLNLAAVRNMRSDNVPFSFLTRQRVKGKPMMVTEWSFCWPNDYITEGPFMMGAVAGFQRWDGLLVFGFEPWKKQMEGCFDLGNKPHARIPFWAAAISYLREDVAPGPEMTVKTPIPRTAEYMGRGVPAEFAIYKRIATEFVSSGADDKIANPLAGNAEIKSADGQLSWHENGLFCVNTARMQGFTGFAGGDAVKLGDIEVRMDNPFGQVIVISLDGKPITESARLLVTATARAENTGQTYKVFRKGLVNTGNPPILLEPVAAKVSFPARKGLKQRGVAYVVDAYLRRTTQKIPLARTEDGTPVLAVDKLPAFAFEVRWE